MWNRIVLNWSPGVLDITHWHWVGQWSSLHAVCLQPRLQQSYSAGEHPQKHLTFITHLVLNTCLVVECWETCWYQNFQDSMFIDTTPYGRHCLKFNKLSLLAKWHTVKAQNTWVCWPSSSPIISKVWEAPRYSRDSAGKHMIGSPSLCKLLYKTWASLWSQ